ncbi:MAG: DEAD/DEAH box helicase, partial [Gammaproteobacteria bacterium]|nr:DEAD/DEAH box helicase [Gammaproteobacteria bacterium]
MNSKNFESLGIGGKFLRALKDVGYTQPTPIQAQAIPHLLRGKDLLGVAQTGTGKTAAFVLPLLQRLDDENSPARPGRPRALILAPTRELALQLHGEFGVFGRYAKLRHSFIFGGVGQNPQVKTLAKGVDVVVATPGRLLDLAGQRHIDLSEVSILVLDEADRLLDMGFVRDVKRIVAQTPHHRQSLLFSATMPKAVSLLARDILNDPIRVDVSPEEMTLKEIEQRVVMVSNGDKQRLLEHLLHDNEVSRAIVFTRTKHGANRVARKLENAGIVAEAIHGNKSQNARQRALQNFKNGDAWVLVATDIAARGIDIDNVSHVINYELPHEPESYVHRIGRTGRAGATGVAYSLVDPSERSRLRAVERLIKQAPVEVVVNLPPRVPADTS